ncbi:putative HofG-like general secretion pathway protein [Chondrocystis sp. NIES-4102]|nr:putative HofG-like general secretion pathway protein [Chondrocystis sp. NIES-4102]
MLNYKIYNYCLILLTIFLGINKNVVNAQSNANSNQKEVLEFIDLVNQTQSSYLSESEKFADNFNDLKITPPNNLYNYNIIDNGKLVQTIATPTKNTGTKTYTGAISYNNNSLNSILCGSRIPGQFLADKIKLVNGQLQCPPGFQILLFNAQKDGLNGVDAINRAQQAYYLETSNFAKDIQQLGFSPSNTYYNYQIQLLENDKLAQVVATPKFKQLKSLLAGTYNNNGSYKSIVCESQKITNSPSGTIKLVDGELQCPTGFQVALSIIEKDALNTVGRINREQQAYYFENSKFANNKRELNFSPSNNYYNYQIQLLENGKQAQVVATSNLNNLKSYIGGIYYFNDSYQSIVCESQKLTKSALPTIKLDNGQLQCPSGFIEKR